MLEWCSTQRADKRYKDNLDAQLTNCVSDLRRMTERASGSASRLVIVSSGIFAMVLVLVFFRCASISWFQVVSKWVIYVLGLAHLRVFQSYFTVMEMIVILLILRFKQCWKLYCQAFHYWNLKRDKTNFVSCTDWIWRDLVTGAVSEQVHEKSF